MSSVIPNLMLDEKKYFPYPALPYSNGTRKNYFVTAFQDFLILSIKGGLSAADTFNVTINGPRIKVFLDNLKTFSRKQTGLSCSESITTTTNTSTLVTTPNFRLGNLDFVQPLPSDKIYVIPEIIELGLDTNTPADWSLINGLPSDISYNEINTMLRRLGKNVYLRPLYANTLQKPVSDGAFLGDLSSASRTSFDPYNNYNPSTLIEGLIPDVSVYASQYLELFTGLKFFYQRIPLSTIIHLPPGTTAPPDVTIKYTVFPAYIELNSIPNSVNYTIPKELLPNNYPLNTVGEKLPIYVGSELNQIRLWEQIVATNRSSNVTSSLFDNDYQGSLEPSQRFALVSGTSVESKLDKNDYIFRILPISYYTQFGLADYSAKDLNIKNVIMVSPINSGLDPEAYSNADAFRIHATKMGINVISIGFPSQLIKGTTNAIKTFSYNYFDVSGANSFSNTLLNLLTNNNTSTSPTKIKTNASQIGIYFSVLVGHPILLAFSEWIIAQNTNVNISNNVGNFKYLLGNDSLTDLSSLSLTIPFMSDYEFIAARSQAVYDPTLLPVFDENIPSKPISDINNDDSLFLKYQKYYKNLFMAVQRSKERESVINLNKYTVPNLSSSLTTYVKNTENGNVSYQPGGYIQGSKKEIPGSLVNINLTIPKVTKLSGLAAINNILDPITLTTNSNVVAPSNSYDIKGALYRQGKLTLNDEQWSVFDTNQQTSQFNILISKVVNLSSNVYSLTPSDIPVYDYRDLALYSMNSKFNLLTDTPSYQRVNVNPNSNKI
jgi:hypothetical protein